MTDRDRFRRSLADLKAEFDLQREVSKHVRLTRRGRVWQGLCPFHAEKSPSFHVYPTHFHCYGCGAHGDVLSFMAAIAEVPVADLIRDLRRNERNAGTPSREALQRLEERRRHAEELANEPDPYTLADTVPPGVPPLWQRPSTQTAPILRPGAALGEALTSQLPVDRMHEFRGGRGELLGYVVRTPRNRLGRKGAYQVGWCTNVRLADGSVREGWTFVSFPAPRPVYGAELITQAQEEGRRLRFLVVEGEKCQEVGAALHLPDDWIPVSWVGGGKGWHHTDWSLVAEAEEIVLWPDADENRSGYRTMQALAAHLHERGATNIRVMVPPADVPDGWDVADAVEDEGWTSTRVREAIQGAPAWEPPLELPPGADQVVPGGMPPEPLPGSGAERPASELEGFVSSRLSFKAALYADAPVLKYVLPGMLEGTVALLVAPGGTGKSWAMLQTCISLACGLDIWGLWGPAFGPLPKGKTIYIAAEDPDVVVRWRQHHLGRDAVRRVTENNRDGDARINADRMVDEIDANLHVFPICGRGPEKQLAIREDRHSTLVLPGPLYHRLAVLGKGALLIGLDTWGRITTALDEREGTDMGQAVDLCESLTVVCPGVAILIAHHTTKAASLNGQGGEQQAASGSRKLTDHVRWQANIETMSATDGEVRGYDDKERRKWVSLSTPKLNYSENEGAQWWYRGEYGILCGAVPLDKPKRKPSGSTYGRRIAGEEGGA
ncbi:MULTISPECIES: CHC2 zinc finger domain-containing protein [Roseicella]|uniref:Zinc finger CHC2-type domain-containing protein n=1 Tax=Roseicella frigidaeris TaxID=2230885 RepID=A0A327LVA4_9PROT|nr:MULTISPECIES: CHC2 zinc finger domain-containing protein [Roseicella]NOG74195.1 AAA family ATPase [Roseicella sp. DB1501]RAI54097.1 hypothetical protein DOO78_26470 [Roseicella frigidaeris]